MKPYRGKRVEALNRIEKFRSALARYVIHYIVHSSSCCSHVQCWLHFFQFERLDRLLFTRTLKVLTRYHDSLWTYKLILLRIWRSRILSISASENNASIWACFECHSLVSPFFSSFYICIFSHDTLVRGEWSYIYPTRLETRTKESNMCASHWVLLNLKAKWKWKLLSVA